MGLLYIAASLKVRRDDDVRVVDAFCENLGREEFVSRMVQERPDVVGLNCSTHTFLEAIGTLLEVHERLPEVRIVLGGYHATFAAEAILKEYGFIDFIIKGEAELAFPRLLDRIERKERPTDVEGISFLDKGEVFSNPISLVEDLDALPFPDRGLLQATEYGYSHEGIKLTTGKFTTISTSRGCPFKCTYCSCAAFSLRKWRPRSAENVVAELEMLHQQGFKNVVIVDDNFTHNVKRAERICELIRERRIKMRYYCEGRVDSASRELMRKMKKAGFDVIYFGAESASDRILEYYKKHITPEKTSKAIENAKAAGMLVITSYIVGAPYEAKEDIEKTIDFIKRTRPHGVQVNILDCLIGTSIWGDLVAQKIVGSEDWKRNHRVYEYFPEHMTRSELEGCVNEAYGAWIKGWYSKEGLLELLGIMLRNGTLRRVIAQNIFNPNVRRRLGEGMKAFGNGELKD